MKKMVQFFKSKRLYRYSFIAAAILVSAAVVYAATVPYTFTSGTVVSSSEVNANFSYLADRSWEKSGSNLYYSSGNVGIGTAEPGDIFHVRKDTATVGASDIKLENKNNQGAARYVLANDGGDKGVLQAVGSAYQMFTKIQDDIELVRIDAGDMNIVFDVSAGSKFNIMGEARSEKVTVDINNGYVGIGTTSPSYPLHMASGAYVTTGGVWTNASSRTYKEHIAELSSNEAIAAFQSLKPVKYNYKVDKDEKHVGFIAEDVPAILATKDRKGVSSMDVVALLTKVVQEQQKTIAVLAKEVEGMKKGRM